MAVVSTVNETVSDCSRSVYQPVKRRENAELWREEDRARAFTQLHPVLSVPATSDKLYQELFIVIMIFEWKAPMSAAICC